MDQLSTDFEFDFNEIDELKTKIEELISKANEIVTWINEQD